jgi:translocation protein SEC63
MIFSLRFVEQRQILLQTPLLLNALLNVSASRNWLTPTLGIMRLNSNLAQALPPNAPPRVRLTQLPGVSKADIDSFSPRPREMTEVLSALEEKGDGRVGTVRKAISKWGRVEIVDAAFKGTFLLTPPFPKRHECRNSFQLFS